MSILKEIWNDPVWSKVISTGLITALAGVASLLSRLSGKGRIAAKIALATGALLSIAVLIVFSLPDRPSMTISNSSSSTDILALTSVRQVSRSPVFDMDFVSQDEVVASLQGSFKYSRIRPEKIGVLAFWRLANGFETNWHVGKRRVGSDYQLALLDGGVATSGVWELFVGGIEMDKLYSGEVSIVLIALPIDTIRRNEAAWLHDQLGWGLADLPLENRVAISGAHSFATQSVRH